MVRVRRILVIAIVASAVGMAGCVMPDQVNQIQRDIGEVQQDIREIRKNQDEAQVRMAALETNLKSEDPEIRARAIVEAVTHYDDPKYLAEISSGMGEPMRGIAVGQMDEKDMIQDRGW